MTDTTPPVGREEVVQADRDAAVAYIDTSQQPLHEDIAQFRDDIAEGRGDAYQLVQAFARHRLAFATQPPGYKLGWRPIEEAPRDGSHILITSDSPLWRYPFVGKWSDAESWWVFSDPCMAGNFAVSELVSHFMPIATDHPGQYKP